MFSQNFVDDGIQVCCQYNLRYYNWNEWQSTSQMPSESSGGIRILLCDNDITKSNKNIFIKA